jgi:serine/threonine protein kinase/Tol biopolymer transport system component
LIGTRIAQYEFIAQIGEGGMGEVYRARDTRLDRDVAIKVLPEHRLESNDARVRFEREAKAVAALSHPNILSIHDFGEHEGMAYAVTELLEGETLYDRLKNGPLPLRRALELAGQMADGLAAAHDKGITHRDIKPANLFLTEDGRLKILDFGLAKSGPLPDSQALTATVRDSTAPGTLLGTVRYMSPEQVRGEEVDPRSDIFAFGTVLWEMLSGRLAFSRDSAVETMNAILNEDPPEVSELGAATPPPVVRIIHRCMEKAPGHRFQSAQDLGFALRNSMDSSNASLPGVQELRPISVSQRRPLLAGLGLLLLGMVIGALAVDRLREPEFIDPVKVLQLTHSGQDWSPTASPDGQTIAFISGRDGRNRVWLRQMQGGTEVPLTEGPDLEPRFSPDGSSVLFLRAEGSTRSAYRVPVVGGPARKVLENVRDACWSPDGDRIAFLRVSGEAASPVVHIGTSHTQSGEIRELAVIEGRFLYGLQWSPDGRWLCVSNTTGVMNAPDNSLLLVDSDTGELQYGATRPTRLSSAAWAADSRSLVFAQSASLVGDMSSSVGQVLLLDPFSGREQPLFWVRSVFAGSNDFVRFDWLNDDSLVFDEILWRGSLDLVAETGDGFSSDGRRLTQGTGRDRQPAFSQDGKLIVFSSDRSGNLDIWTTNLESGEMRQLTDDDADDWDPAFSVDGQLILWSSNRSGNLEIWTARADGSGARQLTYDGRDAENPTQTADGEWIVYASANPDRRGVWKIRSDGSEEIQIASGAYFLPEVSPDGQHVMYLVNDAQKNVSRLLVSDLNTREVVFTTEIAFPGFRSVIQPGRERWMPGGGSFVFVGPDDQGRRSLIEQEFHPGEDTTESRRILVTYEAGNDLESFGISPDGKSIVIARIGHVRSIKLAEGIRR